MVNEFVSKKRKAPKHDKTHTKKMSKQKKDEGHEFRCAPKLVAVIFEYLNRKENRDKRALVEEMGFGALSNLPNYYLKHKVLKELIKRYDIYDNTIHAIAGEVEITTHKIGNALGLSSTGKAFDEKVITKELNEEDSAAHKFFKGKTQAALSKLVMDTPFDTDENKRLFMRAFVLFIQQCFLLPTSAANVTPRALLTIFDVENTRRRKWALHVHNFLLEEVKKAMLHNTKSINGCCYAMLIIYFHVTYFGKNAKEPEAQPPWIRY
ncbi:hypothetical protein PIB30_048665 [Stylosanthes scabra]|uniref:Uncharacterized protein n=1 Tax=Stylosanthes scabra TaxID=79078 RepID=A0ABU6YEH7_9FABA|nr:hypothetical protein [Stylosanthes scabra]